MGLISDSFRLVPLVHVASLLRNASHDFGPDTPFRIVSTAQDLELAMLGKVALGARSPGEALARVVEALPYYCAHEQVSWERKPGRYVVREVFAHRFDPETLHLLLQYASAMLDRILAPASQPSPRFVRLEIPPHPVHGIEHLRRWFGDSVVATKASGITMEIEDRVMERPFSKVARNRLTVRGLDDGKAMQRDGSVADSVRTVLGLMIESGEKPSIKRVVATAGVSARTFQRQLEAEGTSFSELLTGLRQSETLKRLGQDDVALAAIATDLGYCDQATFTRAFRRWTGSPPGQFRARAN
ncbi:AraC family transcriptional regulator [Xanthobacter oligotrophicus]|nr:AraC family transcriptional regulator [Xanthobacter oligotrophicus]